MALNERSDEGSQLFLVRLWADPDKGAEEHPVAEMAPSPEAALRHCHGKVQHVMTGRAANFVGWPALMDVLKSMMPYDQQQSFPGNEPGQ